VLTETVERLRAVALAAPDASGHFPAMYARVTDQVQRDVAAGRFRDAERMERFVRVFAEWYPRPPAPGRVDPGSWRAAFDVAGDRGLLIVQHLLLGINAHVNHDLPQVVVELADGVGGAPPQPLDSLRPDFDAVNDVLAEMLPVVVRDLGTVSRWVQAVAARGGGQAFDFSLTAARRQAWATAVRLHGMAPAQRRAEVVELDRLVRVLAFMVATPAGPTRWLVRAGRLLEERDPRVVTRRLLGDLA
jgi:hypothetical protein